MDLARFIGVSMISYRALVKNKNNRMYIKNFVDLLYASKKRGRLLSKYFTQQELYNLLFDEVYSKYFKVYYEGCISAFIFIFEKNALEVAYVLHDEEILKYCFDYFAPNNQVIVDFLRKHPDANTYLLTDYNLSTFLNYNLFHDKPFLENLSIDFIQENIGYISYIISCKFPYAQKRFLKEIENLSFSLKSIISSFPCGARKELISFLNAYQKQCDINLELYKKDIIKVLFSHKDMEDIENNPYLKALEMVLDDIKPNNIGKYRAICYEYFKNMYIANESIGFLGDNYEIPLEGELVLADTDYLEYEKTCKINNCLSVDWIYQYIKEYSWVKTVRKKVNK